MKKTGSALFGWALERLLEVCAIQPKHHRSAKRHGGEYVFVRVAAIRVKKKKRNRFTLFKNGGMVYDIVGTGRRATGHEFRRAFPRVGCRMTGRYRAMPLSDRRDAGRCDPDASRRAALRWVVFLLAPG